MVRKYKCIVVLCTKDHAGHSRIFSERFRIFIPEDVEEQLATLVYCIVNVHQACQVNSVHAVSFPLCRPCRRNPLSKQQLRSSAGQADE